MFDKIKTLFTKKRVDFREAYESLPSAESRTSFKHALMSANKWNTKRSFYDAMDGKIYLDEKQINELHYLLNNHKDEN